METVRGNLVRKRYRSSDGEWTVGLFRETDRYNGRLTGNEFVVTGPLPNSDPDEVLEISGDWETKQGYGKQFKATAAMRVIPVTTEGLEKFLYKEVRGIGPMLASRLANHFKGDLEKILDNNPERFTEVEGVTPAKAKVLKEAWAESRAQHPVKIFLAHHGINPDWSSKIINKFGYKAITVLSDNPYKLHQVEGIGFKISDRMALMISPSWSTSPERVQAAFSYSLQEATNNGHCYLDRGPLLNNVMEYTGVDLAMASEELDKVVDKKELIAENVSNDAGESTQLLYLPSLYDAETDFTESLIVMKSIHYATSPNLEETIQAVQGEQNIVLSHKQREAVVKAFSNHCSIITGPPGCGKTTTTLTIVHTAERLGKNVLLACPTGRAAKRLADITKREASTIHRLLGFNRETNDFTRSSFDPIEADLLILDEFSMVDIQLAASLFEAIPPTCSVVIIGDADQLPAVGPGMVLRDVIDSNQLPITVLDTVFRQAEGSLIIQNAHRIRKGEEPTFLPKGIEANMYLLPVPTIKDIETNKNVEDVEWLKKTLVSLVKEFIPQRLNLNSLRDVQVLVPMKKNSAGVHAINDVLREALNPDGARVNIGKHEFRIGDRVIQTKNNYSLEVYNGDIGFILGYNNEDKTLQVEIDGKTIDYNNEDLDELQLAYAMTVHKSQGSEYPVTIVLMLWQHRPMLERNLLYTATTRAKRMALFIGNKHAINYAVNNSAVHKRNTFLMQRLRKALDKAEETAHV